MSQLIIVESPTKSKTIGKFLGKNFLVKSSYGHIRDLPKSKLGVDVEKDFAPQYIIPIKARKTVKELKSSIKKADLLILATDEDREGEAIAWHITKALDTEKLKIKTQRIVFHEITKKAIEKAIENPREINMQLVDAQQARRILDRLVGYELSPFLWKKIAKGLSAGRVQSVAVRLIVDRENEIKKFKPEEYWSIEAELQKNSKNFIARLIKANNKAIPKLGIKIKQDADKILQDLNKSKYQVVNVEKKQTKRNPLPPFTTSTLQQEASRRFGFSAKQTMRFAQQLYEAGSITYHRTDSLNLSKEAIDKARELIKTDFGPKYIPETARFFKTKSKGAQEAHEAIRPTLPSRLPNKKDKLYNLIWQRFIACQMSEAILDSLTIDIQAKHYLFRANGSTIKFDGFLKVYPTKTKEVFLPPLNKNNILKLIKLISEQHFTMPPARYTEASLIKILEEYGIGRPSTYAPTISTIQNRRYVIKNEQKRFVPEEMGILVVELLKQHFPKIVDIQFTAGMEKDLDRIADGKEKWQSVIKNFYKPFHENLTKKYESVEKKNLDQETDKICPECGKPIIIKIGRFGKFYSCSGFPECKHTEAIVNSTGVKCPECEKGEIVERRTRKGKIFYSCNQYPKCKHALWNKPIGEKCPDCGSLLMQSGKNKIKCSKKECSFEKEAELTEE